jgi:hypothetical protein
MLFKLGLIILFTGVAASAAIFFFFDEALDDIEERQRKHLEKCLYANSNRKNND